MTSILWADAVPISNSDKLRQQNGNGKSEKHQRTSRAEKCYDFVMTFQPADVTQSRAFVKHVTTKWVAGRYTYIYIYIYIYIYLLIYIYIHFYSFILIDMH